MDTLPAPFCHNLFEARGGYGLAKNERLGEIIGRGANNEVVKIVTTSTSTLPPRVLRRPLAKSDSRHTGRAMSEAKMTMRLSELGVGPRVHDIWYVRKSQGLQKKGLHMILDMYETDLTHIIEKDPQFILSNAFELRMQIQRLIEMTTEAGIFTYDIKPANVIVRRSPLECRFIDFGADYCEYIPDALQKVDDYTIVHPIMSKCLKQFGSDELAVHNIKEGIRILMIVLMSAHIYDDAENSDNFKHVLHRYRANFMAAAAADARRGMSEVAYEIMTRLIRWKGVKGTLEHYFDDSDVLRLSHFHSPPKMTEED